MDSLIFMTDSVKSTKVEECVTDRRLSSVPEASQEEIKTSEKEIEVEIEVENVERPVDLYKVINQWYFQLICPCL